MWLRIHERQWENSSYSVVLKKINNAWRLKIINSKTKYVGLKCRKYFSQHGFVTQNRSRSHFQREEPISHYLMRWLKIHFLHFFLLIMSKGMHSSSITAAQTELPAQCKYYEFLNVLHLICYDYYSRGTFAGIVNKNALLFNKEVSSITAL